MVRRFFKDSALYGFATILSKGLTVLMVPIYTAFLSKTQLGLLDLLLGAMAVLSMIIGLDISNALAREYGESGDYESKRRYSSTALWFSVGIFGVAMALILPGAGSIAHAAFGDVAAAPAVTAAALCMACSGIYLVVAQQLRWMMQPGKFGIVSVWFTLVSLSTTLLLVSKYRMGEVGVLYGTMTGAAAGLLLALWFCRGEFALSFNSACLRQMLVFCIPIVPSSLAVVVSQYASRFVLEHDLGRDAVGVFGVATRLGGLAGLVMLGFGSALTPLIYAGHHDPGTPKQLARIFRIFVAVAALGLAGLTLFAPEILALLTRSDYSAAMPLLGWLAPAFLLSQMYIFAPGAWIRRRMWWVAAINFGTAAAAVGLNLLLVPRFGLTGAALATVLAAGLNFGFNMVVSQKFYPVPHHWRALGAVVIIGMAAMVAAAFLPREISLINLLWKSGLLAMVAMAIIGVGGVEWEWLRRGWDKCTGGPGRRG
jgi:O-antigen/teichoic acid export membrane protein